uniref:WD repeat-containing protein 36 (Trinotate prediction) n=1 Tax=Myxobolus squamalis TaxID=59785 RepID=A0A6B2FZ63_MYXSQ
MVGYSKGALEVFNLQTGEHSGSFIDPSPSFSSVVGVVIDRRNHLSADIDDSTCKIWFFMSRQIKARIKLSIKPTQMEINRESSLIAIAGCGRIFIIDLDTNKTIRCFCENESSAITDICLSHDARWVLAASDDSFIRMWDLPSSR